MRQAVEEFIKKESKIADFEIDVEEVFEKDKMEQFEEFDDALFGKNMRMKSWRNMKSAVKNNVSNMNVQNLWGKEEEKLKKKDRKEFDISNQVKSSAIK